MVTKTGSGHFRMLGDMELGSVVMKFGSATQQNALLHLATNSIQHYWTENDAGEKSLQQVQCAACFHPFTILHLSDCPAAEAVGFRHTLKERLLQSLRRSQCDRNWLSANQRLDLPSFVRQLFPLPADAAGAEAIRRHTARCMMGAFSKSEANAAAKLLQFPLSNARPTAMELFRCCCVDQLSLSYTLWKL
jgi:hypothetical protein